MSDCGQRDAVTTAGLGAWLVGDAPDRLDPAVRPTMTPRWGTGV